LVDNGVRVPGKIDWLGNATFALGLTSLLTGVVYGIQPYGGHPMGWTNPIVLAELVVGVMLLVAFAIVETRVEQPMFRLPLFRLRAFTAGNVAGLLAALARGGLQFMLIIWLQGIWLPRHGYSFQETPLWAGVRMVPLTVGLLVAAPISGALSDRYGARGFASAGMAGAAVSFGLLEALPIDFQYVWFALVLLIMGLSLGLFASPNRAAIMNSLPADQRGAGAGMTTTFQNSASVLSIGIFFTVITLGLAASLPAHLYAGLTANGVPATAAHQIAKLPPIGALFASLLGYNPIQQILGPSGVLQHVSSQQAATLTSRAFFPQLISQPFAQGLHYAFDFGIACMAIAAVASLMRGRKLGAPDRTLMESVEQGAAAGGDVVEPSLGTTA
jgi:MFS family permease